MFFFSKSLSLRLGTACSSARPSITCWETTGHEVADLIQVLVRVPLRVLDALYTIFCFLQALQDHRLCSGR